MWTLELGIEFIRKLENIISKLQAHAALAGGVLKNGKSEKDLDVIIYKHCTAYSYDTDEVIKAIENSFQVKDILPKTLKYKNGGDEKDVRVVYLKSGRRIDFFFL